MIHASVPFIKRHGSIFLYGSESKDPVTIIRLFYSACWCFNYWIYPVKPFSKVKKTLEKGCWWKRELVNIRISC